MDPNVNPLSIADAVRADRRRTRRVDVRINLVGQASSSRVLLANVSAGGCLLYASCLLKADETHTLRFKVDPDGEELVIQARVVHAIGVRGHGDIGCVAGMEFTDHSASQRVAIERLIEAAL